MLKVHSISRLLRQHHDAVQTILAHKYNYGLTPEVLAQAFIRADQGASFMYRSIVNELAIFIGDLYHSDYIPGIHG